jgi:S1-C subfamily serine protease
MRANGLKASVLTLTTLSGVLGLAGQAAGQDTSVPARYGVANLQGDFQPDPYIAEVEAGGGDDASRLGSGCAGYISNERPDYELNYANSSNYDLGFYVLGDVDTTLVINDPAGGWFCNDDFDAASGRNPGIVFTDPRTGNYDIWVGAYSQSDTGADVELVITEIGPPWSSTSSTPAPSGGPPGSRLAASGTGFLVSRAGHVLTNHHVIDECTRMTFQVRGELAVEANLLSSNQPTDLALLKTPLAGGPAQFRGGTAVRLGDEVVVFGFPLLGDLSSQGNLTYGIVSALSGLNDDLSRMQMTAQIQPGNSGGPVLDRAGNIVGVVVETANDEYFRRERGTVAQNVNFAIRDSLARSFLDTNNVRYEVAAESGPQLAIADIAERAQGYTGIILCYQ